MDNQYAYSSSQHLPHVAANRTNGAISPKRRSQGATFASSTHASRASSLDDDRATIERTRSTPDAFALLYQKYASEVFRYCLRRLRDWESAEDVTSQVFLNAFRALPTLRNQPFRAWLFSIAHNAVVDIYRSNQPHMVSLDSLHDWEDPGETLESIAIRQESRDTVRTVLERLPKRDRDVITLRLAGLDGPEIAQVLHCSHDTARMAQHRAMKRMRHLMTMPKTQP